MDPVILSRLQFATTTIYHFFFVPLTLGLGWIVACLETLYVLKKDETYKLMAKFWGKLFLINFAMGVVTGIVLEFQFGMNWSTYARFVGDIFGAPLAMEALTSFFLESVFLGIWVFGWDRISKGLHLVAIWLVAIGSNLSALWILLANGFMQHPVGYVINNGRAEMVDFSALITNPRGWLLFWHALAAGLVTASFFVLGISAYHLFRKQNHEMFRKSFMMAAFIGIFSTILVGVFGDAQGKYLRIVQPMAAAATEALYDTDDPAPFSVIAIFDLSGKNEIWSLRVPYVLSFLYYNQPAGEVRGINDLQRDFVRKNGPGNYVPSVALTFWMFRIMVGVGLLMVAVAAFAVFLAWKKWPDKWTKSLKWMVWVIPLPYISNTSGWILTEAARQPWNVHGLLRTQNAMSPNLTAGMVAFTLSGFALTYTILMVVDIYLLKVYATAGPSSPETGDLMQAGAEVDY
jgi:cytochrome bd ubiquinol oxidase subunit I